MDDYDDDDDVACLATIPYQAEDNYITLPEEAEEDEEERKTPKSRIRTQFC